MSRTSGISSTGRLLRKDTPGWIGKPCFAQYDGCEIYLVQLRFAGPWAVGFEKPLYCEHCVLRPMQYLAWLLAEFDEQYGCKCRNHMN